MVFKVYNTQKFIYLLDIYTTHLEHVYSVIYHSLVYPLVLGHCGVLQLVQGASQASSSSRKHSEESMGAGGNPSMNTMELHSMNMEV